VWIGATPVLGRLGPEAARAVADVADRYGSGEVRLTPWRSVILPGVDAARAGHAVAALEAAGLSTDPADPVHDVIACAGSEGCPKGVTDTQADGAHLVALLRRSTRAERRRSVPAFGATVHLSGCPKSCATREACDVTLVGGPVPGTYELFRRVPAGVFQGDSPGPPGFQGDSPGPPGFQGDSTGPPGFQGDSPGPPGFQGDTPRSPGGFGEFVKGGLRPDEAVALAAAAAGSFPEAREWT
jgi:hypothetical protein